jgi:hypothetical protein
VFEGALNCRSGGRRSHSTDADLPRGLGP